MVRSHIGFGSPHKQDTSSAHGSPLGEEEVRLTKEVYGWDPDKHFYVPEDALKHFRGCVERGAELRVRMADAASTTTREAHPELATEVGRLFTRGAARGWDAEVPRFHASGTMTATTQVFSRGAAVGGRARSRAGRRIRRPGALDPHGRRRRGRRADGVSTRGATSTSASASTPWARSSTASPSTIFRAFGSTFFNFSDYMRGSMRLAALMRLPSIFVFTHDSIGLGEDGPTHQPIEQLAGLRAMPRAERDQARRRE